MWVIPEDLGNFSPKKEKNLGEQKFARLSVLNFCGRIFIYCFDLTAVFKKEHSCSSNQSFCCQLT